MIQYLPHEDFLREKQVHPWYEDFGITPRAFTRYGNEPQIFIDRDAFFIDDFDRQLLIAHEQGHTEGREHSLFGIMSDNGFIRYLTWWL